MAKLSNDERNRAVGLLQAGASKRLVANTMHCHVTNIRRLWRKFQQTGAVQDQARVGRPRVTTAQQDRSYDNRIDEESDNIYTLLAAAKAGDWTTVWDIVGIPNNSSKGYLLNVIPENRRWGILHQAVFWNDPDILRMLLKFKECDTEMKAKECTSEVGQTGLKISEEIAQEYGHTQMCDILSKHVCTIENQQLETFHPWMPYIESRGLRLMQITLSAYKYTFHPQPISPQASIMLILAEVVTVLNRSENKWKHIRNKVLEAAYVVCNQTEIYEQMKKCSTKNEFFRLVINIYTNEETMLYTHLNVAMRRQKLDDYTPTADDLALGPYVVIFQILLLFWKELTRENGNTYRRMLVSDVDLQKYQIGTKFSWLTFVSSSTVLENALPFPTCGPTGDNPIIFTIDNSMPSAWQPRNIEEYAEYMENERVYPAGASFMVTERRQMDKDTHLRIKLLSRGSVSATLDSSESSSESADRSSKSSCIIV